MCHSRDVIFKKHEMHQKTKNPTSGTENGTLDVEVEMIEQVSQGIENEGVKIQIKKVQQDPKRLRIYQLETNRMRRKTRKVTSMMITITIVILKMKQIS